MSGPNGETEFGAQIPKEQILYRAKSAQKYGSALALPPEIAEPLEELEKQISTLSRQASRFDGVVLPEQASKSDKEVFDSPDEIATKEAAKDFLNNLPSATETPTLPVQYDNPVAKKLFQLYLQGIIDSDEKQGIRSQLYQSPSNGKVILCRDMRDYDENATIDPCYAYARYGIGLYTSQHIIYRAYGIEDTAFIADNAQKFYEKFITNIKAFESNLPGYLTEKLKEEKVHAYALRHLSAIAHNIATELTAQLGEQHSEFEDITKSLYSLDEIVISSNMAFRAIPYATIKKISHQNINKEYATIVHPKPGKMTKEIAELYKSFNIADNTEEQNSFLFSDTEEEEKLIAEGRGEHNFFDDLKPCKKRVAFYFKPAVLAGEVTLCSQNRGDFVGVKNVRTITTVEVMHEQGGMQFRNVGTITANSTALAAFKNVSEATLQDYVRRTLLQLHKTMANGSGRKERLCGISLCGIDIKTTFDNNFSDKEAQIDALDAKIARLTAAAAEETEGKVYFNNLAINYERLAVLIKGDDIASRLAQNAITALTGYKNLPEMLNYVYHVVGIIENIAYMQEFIDQYRLLDADRYRFEQYLQLMARVLTAGSSGNPANSRDTFLDTAAVFAMLCDVHNELVIKYDPDKKIDFIKPFFNCASGENRSGAAIFRHMELSLTVDIIGVANIPQLLDAEYYPLRRAIGNKMAKAGIIQYDNESCGSTPGTGGVRKKNADSFSPKDISPDVLYKYMLTENASLKTLMPKPSSKEGEYVYIPEKGPITIGHQREKQPVVGIHTQSENKAQPSQQGAENKSKNDLKKGSILGLLGLVTLTFIAAFVEHLHTVLYMVGTLAAAGALTMGFVHSREAEADKKAKLGRNSSGFFQRKSEPIVEVELQDIATDKHNRAPPTP